MIDSKIILIISCVFTPEPLVSARISEELADQLSGNCKVVVLCPRPTRPLGVKYSNQDREGKIFSVVTLQSYTYPESRIWGRMRESISFGRACARYIQQNHPDIKCIYVNSHPLFSQYKILTKAKKYKIPCIMHIQDIYPESLMSKLGKIGRICYPLLKTVDSHFMKKATRIIAISPNMKRVLVSQHQIPNGKIDIVYNWQDERPFVNQGVVRKENQPFTFMFVGSVSPSANLVNVIHAFGQTNLNNTRLIIAGNGSDKQRCIEVAKNYPTFDITFCEVTPKTVPQTEAMADILILPLMPGIAYTALPSKLPAYMYSSRPILVCAESDSDLAGIIYAADCGFVVPPTSIKDLSDAMNICASLSKEELDRKGINGMQYALKNFTKKINLHELTRIILENAYDN